MLPLASQVMLVRLTAVKAYKNVFSKPLNYKSFVRKIRCYVSKNWLASIYLMHRVGDR